MIHILNDEKLGQVIESHNLYEEIGLAPNQYKRWCDSTLKGYGIENSDYYNFNTMLKLTSTNKKTTIVYRLTVNFAKELCMMARTENAKKIRQYLIELANQRESGELFNEEEIIFINQLKNFFKFVDNQKQYYKKHGEHFVENYQGNKNPYAEFNIWRNSILNIDSNELDSMIKQYCIENSKCLPKIKTNHEKIRFLNEYDSLKNAVWDFLNIKGVINSLKIANLVKKLAESENLLVYSRNEETFFQKKEVVNETKMIQ